MDDFREECEKQIPTGIIIFVPGNEECYLVKLASEVYAYVYTSDNTVVPSCHPYNPAIGCMNYMREHNITVSEKTKQKVMEIVNAKKDEIRKFYKG